MRIAAFSDWRVQPFEPLIAWLEKVKPDLILYAGDDTVRLGGLTDEALELIALQSVDEEKGLLGLTSETFEIEYDTTLSKFKNSLKDKFQKLKRYRMTPTGLVPVTVVFIFRIKISKFSFGLSS